MSTTKWLGVVAVAVVAGAVAFGSLPLASLVPFVFLLICPLAMFFMMKGMGGMGAAHGDHSPGKPQSRLSDRDTPARSPQEPGPGLDASVDSQYRD